MDRSSTHPEDAASDHNVFADEHRISTPAMSEYEFSMADGFGMTDGYRPNTAEIAPRSSRIARLSSSSLRRSVLLGFGPDRGASPSAPTRNSIAKDPSIRHSFTLANDGSRAPVERRGGRMGSSSESSSSAILHAGLLLPEANGGLRPISSMSRGPEVFDMELPTITRPQSALDVIARPAHPYALYQQSVEPMAEVGRTTPGAVPPIQVGFPGRNVNYHRQRGPDGEEQDIIGPDGHAEQLPAYTEHADANEKFYAARSRAEQRSPSRNRQSQAIPVIPMTESEGSPYIALTPVTPAVSPASMESLPTTIVPEKEKTWGDKSWREKRKTKVLCGIPLWVLLVAAACIAFIGVVLGSVLGAVLGRGTSSATPMMPMNTSRSAPMFDAVPIPQPTNLGPIPTGSYFLPLGPPEATDSDCITSLAQSKAWSCSVPPVPLLFDMSYPPGGYYVAKLNSPPPPPGVAAPWNYGPQPPKIMPGEKLTWVKDTTEPQRGPALYFQTIYDKTVVLQGDTFTVQGKRKRGDLASNFTDDFFDLPPPPPPKGKGVAPPPPKLPFLPPPPPPSHDKNETTTPAPGLDPDRFAHGRKGTVQPGDEPWFCFWNATHIEGFIYVTEPLTTSVTTSSPMASTITSTISATMAVSAVTTQQSTTFNSSIPTSPTMVSTVPSITSPSQTHARREAMASAQAAPHNHNRDHQVSSPTGSYPYPIKVVERRLPTTDVKGPYCQKMSITNDGSVQPVLDDDGNPLEVAILERDPSNDAYKATATATATAHSRVKRGIESLLQDERRRQLVRRSGPGNSCGCRWLSTGQP